MGKLLYVRPVPYRFQVHNLEHGGIILHLGNDLSAEARKGVEDLWRESPAYLLVVPEENDRFPGNAIVVTSWQRWMVCDPYDSADRAAIRVYRDTYRGTGPEHAPATNSGEGDATDGLPTPKFADPDSG
jgi:hypothetical protein